MDDLFELGARVVSVFGPFNSRVMFEMSSEAASKLFSEPLVLCGHTTVIEAAQRDIESVRKRDAELADSALAASAVALAYEIENPYNSATSKSMCARELRDTLDRLRELAPKAKEKDGLDDLSARRAARLGG